MSAGTRFSALGLEAGPLGAQPPRYRTRVDAAQWSAAAADVAGQGERLVALWGTDRGPGAGARHAVAAAYATAQGLYWLELPLPETTAGTPASYPDLATHFPGAVRMQRAVADLSGYHAEGAADTRAWLRHASWPAGFHPLRAGAELPAPAVAADENYPFVTVEGDGVHEIAVGPVHAGIIEPGHFRFSVVGEKVLRLEERLGYVHKGVDRRFAGLDAEAGVRLAARVSGDSTVAFAWAACEAVESACAAAVPPRAQALRALALERERIANHLGDLGALGNDAAFAFGLAQFSRLREDWLRRNAALCGHRLLMDWVVPGGLRADLDGAGRARLAGECDVLEDEVRRIEAIYDGHAGLQDRFAGTGRVTTELAHRLQITGLAARASGLDMDLRRDHPVPPYDGLRVRRAAVSDGDVAARVAVRFAEVYESLRLIRAIAGALPEGPVRIALPAPAAGATGAGWVEGWRGEVLVALEFGAGGHILRGHCHDPSWQNWPALEHAVIGNIVPDFPLINKSFNLSYSGQDL